MYAIMASAMHLCEKAKDTHPHIDALYRLRVVLACVVACYPSDTIFASWLKKMLDDFLTSFSIVTGMVDNLTARIQAMRRAAYETVLCLCAHGMRRIHWKIINGNYPGCEYGGIFEPTTFVDRLSSAVIFTCGNKGCDVRDSLFEYIEHKMACLHRAEGAIGS